MNVEQAKQEIGNILEQMFREHWDKHTKLRDEYHVVKDDLTHAQMVVDDQHKTIMGKNTRIKELEDKLEDAGKRIETLEWTVKRPLKETLDKYEALRIATDRAIVELRLIEGDASMGEIRRARIGVALDFLDPPGHPSHIHALTPTLEGYTCDICGKQFKEK